MQNKDWLETSEEILKSVVAAVEKQDYAGLSKTVENKINDAVEQINEKVKVHYGVNNMRSSTYQTDKVVKPQQPNRSSQIAQPPKKQEPVVKQQIVPVKSQVPILYASKPRGTYSANALKIIGTIGASMTGVSVFVLSLVGIATGSWGVWLANGLVGGGLLGSIGMIRKGNRLSDKVSRFKQYVARLGKREYIEIEQLAMAVGKRKNFVQKELREMIAKKYFLQGHLDDTGTTLITSDAMYKQYLEAENSRRNLAIGTSKKEVPLLEQNSNGNTEEGQYPAEVQKILQEGKEYIDHIHTCNDMIPDEIMSDKLAKLEDIIIRIFEQLKKNPNNVADLQRMMKYYLPTTRKLIDAYCELEGQPSYGDSNIFTMKKEIEDTLDVVNDAFGKLFDDMFEDAAWDISTEISTMKTMLAKEGLTGERDFQLSQANTYEE